MNHRIHFIWLAGLLLGACGLPDDIDQLDEDLDPGPAPVAGTELDSNPDPASETAMVILPIDAQCIDDPVIGILSDDTGACDLDGTLPAGWTAAHVFEDASPIVDGLVMPVPDSLALYCQYEYDGGGSIHTAVQELVEAIGDYPLMDLSTVASACRGLGPMAGLNDPDVLTALSDATLLNADAIDEDALPVLNLYSLTPPSLVLLDTANEASLEQGFTPGNPHATLLSALAKDIACFSGDPDCEAQITHTLVTPFIPNVQSTENYDTGHDVGDLITLAQGTYAAVQSWRRLFDNGQGGPFERLILNISVASDINGAPFATDPNRGPMRAATDALRMARCYGALPIAAAGNVRDDSCPAGESGLLFPALAETISAPTELECQAMGFAPQWDLGTYPVHSNLDEPLAYAIGGTDGLDQVIGNQRENSVTRQLAISRNAVATSGDTPLMGTSIGTLVTSATAFLLWSVEPTLRPSEVMEAIYDGSYPLSYNADAGKWAGTEARRLSVCSALETIGVPLGCDAPPPDPNAHLEEFFNASSAIIAGISPALVAEHDGQNETVGPTCSMTPLTDDLVPQPRLPICAVCSAHLVLGGSGENDYVALTTEYDGKGDTVLIDNAVLELDDGLGNVVSITFDASAVASLNDPTIDLVKIYFDNNDVETALLTFDYTDGSSQANSLVVYEEAQ